MAPALMPSLATATARDTSPGRQSSRSFALLAPGTIHGVDAVIAVIEGEPDTLDGVCEALQKAFSRESGSRAGKSTDGEAFVAGQLAPIPLDGVGLALAVQMGRSVVCASRHGHIYVCTAAACENVSAVDSASDGARGLRLTQFSPALDDCLVLVSSSAGQHVTQAAITETTRGFTNWFSEQDAADWLGLLAARGGGRGLVAVARFVPPHMARKDQRAANVPTEQDTGRPMLVTVDRPPEPTAVLPHTPADAALGESQVHPSTAESRIERETVSRSREPDTPQPSRAAPVLAPAPPPQPAGAEAATEESSGPPAARRRRAWRWLVPLPIVALLVLGGVATYALRPASSRHHAAGPPPRPAPVTLLRPPGAPSVAQSGPTRFTVSWSRVPGADHYVVSLDGRSHPTASPPLTMTASLQPGTTHAWRVDAVNSAGRSAASPSVHFRVRPMPALAWSFPGVLAPATDALLTLYNSTSHTVAVQLRAAPFTLLSANSVQVPARSSAEIGMRSAAAHGSAPALGVTVQCRAPILAQRMVFTGTTSRTEYGVPVSAH